MSAFANWDECAEKLPATVRARADHAHRWRASLRPESAFTRILGGAGVEGTTPIDSALDAAVGIAIEAERLQRSCFSKEWEKRQGAFRRALSTLGLPLQAPPGLEDAPWAAFKAVMESDLEDWDEARKVLPEEVELLGQLEKRAPDEYRRMVDAALAVGGRVDRDVRRGVVAEVYEMDTLQLFRTAWVTAFGNERIRTAAPFNIAAAVLRPLLSRAREVGLFLEHVGVTERRLGDSAGQVRRDILDSLDDDVHTAMKQWRRKGMEPGSPTGITPLTSAIELVTYRQIHGATPQFLAWHGAG